MTNKEFEKLVEEGIAAIPEKFLQKLKNVEICIEDNPAPWQLKSLKIKGSLLFGLYEGIPQTERESYGQVLPDKITIFKKEIETAAGSEEEIRKIVKDTIWHEIAHHFGMSETEVEKSEKRRK
ncbi:MAG: metallopeptidase family protein [Candidatus Staskawiczbacteria bacterium]|nr:metallopeptidase family protein [Candidatus Staskawiczbacteria bacterium]